METLKAQKNEKKINGSEAHAKESAQPSQNSSGQARSLPTREELGKWIDHDLKAALAFLNILNSRPEIVKMIADAVHEDSVNGPKLPL